MKTKTATSNQKKEREEGGNNTRIPVFYIKRKDPIAGVGKKAARKEAGISGEVLEDLSCQ